ncbi:MAG TPA: helix-turn-helix domain-containing protein [Candidatus Thermoplasmatota archaeon]|nr:helix-turn-helix domain-containing protein [Candidatus Thermoplasmatota archaeon]
MQAEIEALRTLGLTEYGARAYAALASLGPSGAEVVARAAPVPRTKVYAVLADLARRGWVDVEEGRPRRYRARRPADCFERERARVAARLDAALPLLEARYQDRSRRFAGALWMLQGEETVAERALAMVAEARQDVMLVASFPLSVDRKELPRALRDAVRRGVRVRLAAPDLEAPHARALRAPGVEARTTRIPPRFLSVDRRQALIAFPLPRGDGFEVNAVWNPSPELLSLMAPVLEGLWETAEIPGKGWEEGREPVTRASAAARPRRGTPRRSSSGGSPGRS